MLHIHAKPIALQFVSDFRASELPFQALSPIRFLVLASASVFFLLKLIDVRWLRFRTDLRAMVAWIVIVNILHLGVLNRGAGASFNPSQHGLEIVLFVGGVLAATSILCVLRKAASGRDFVRPPSDASFHSVWTWCAIFRSMCEISRTNPRGPPMGSLRRSF